MDAGVVPAASGIAPLARLRRLRGSVFVKAVAGTAGANVIAAALGSIGGIIIARYLGAEIRGYLVTAVVWPTFAGTIATLGLPQATCFHISKDEGSGPSVVASVTIGALVITAALGVVGALLAPLISSEPSVVRALQLLFLLLPLYTIPVSWMASLQPRHIALWNTSRIVQPVVYFAAVLFLALTDRLTIPNVVNGLIVSFATQAIVAAGLSWWKIGRPAAPKWALWSSSVKFGMKTSFANAPLIVNTRVDQLFLSLLVSPAALGNYAVAVSLSWLATPVAWAFGYVAFPRIASAKRKVDAARIQKIAIWGSVGVGAVVLIPLAIAAPWLIPALFGSGFDSAVTVLWILVPGTIFFCANQVMEDVARGHGRPGVPAVAESIGAVLTGVLLAILAPRFGINGAAVASVITYSLVGAILIRSLRLGDRVPKLDDSVRSSDAIEGGGEKRLADGDLPSPGRLG